MPRLTKRERSIAANFKRYEKLKEKAGTLYDQADALLAKIAGLMRPRGAKLVEVTSKTGNVSHRLIARISEDGRELHCIDKTAGDAIILDWGHAAVRRYELKVVNP
jgi:hypothetical protein